MIQGTTELVLIPGLNNTSQLWADVVAALPAWVNAHALDCPPLDSVEAIADELIKALPERFYLCGFSFGGYVALAMLNRYPERIVGLILAGTSAAADSPEHVALRRQLIEKLAVDPYEELIAAQAHRAFHPASLDRKDVQKVRRQMLRDYGADRLVAHLQACIARPDRSELLQEMGIPLLVAAGADDAVIPLVQQQAMANEVSGAEFVAIPEAGHLVPLEKPAQLAQCLTHWLQQVS